MVKSGQKSESVAFKTVTTRTSAFSNMYEKNDTKKFAIQFLFFIEQNKNQEGAEM